MPNEKEKGPGIEKLERIADGTGPKAKNAQKALENMGFRMQSPEVAYMAKVAGTPSIPMEDENRVMRLEHEDKINLVIRLLWIQVVLA